VHETNDIFMVVQTHWSMLEKIALEDGNVDDHERALLSRIYSRVTADGVEPNVSNDIVRFKSQHQIP